MRALLERGSVRIGTLFDWRESGKYGEMARDQSEGLTKTPFNIIFYDHRFIDTMQLESRVWIEGEGSAQVRRFRNEVLRTPDLYTFSAASTYSEETHRQWFEAEGYDACYRIDSVEQFGAALTRKLVSCKFVIFEPVLYFDEEQANQVFPDTFHPALLKSKCFGGQNEVRALWQPYDQGAAISPLVINESEAWRYCEAFRILKH